jgi:hypothetical protein
MRSVFWAASILAVLALASCNGDSVEICDDDDDNDGDTLIDCDDSECNAEANCTSDDVDDSDVPEVDEDCSNGADDDGDDDADCDDEDCLYDEACLEPNPYTTYTGYERLQFGVNDTEGTGALNCRVHWDAVGTPREYNCPWCTFTFDVALTVNTDETFDDGATTACEDWAEDSAWTYGYAEDYYGYSYLLFEYEGEFVPWTEASFEDGTFTYFYGYTDYLYEDAYYYPDYEGKYLTWYFDGEASVAE